MSCYSLPGAHSFVSGSWSAFWSTQKSNTKNKTTFQMRITQKESKIQRPVSQLKLPSSSDRFSVCRVPVWSYISLIKVSCSVKSLRCSLGDLRSHSWKPLQHCTDMARKNRARSIWDDASTLSLIEVLHDCRKVTLFLWTSLFNLQNKD